MKKTLAIAAGLLLATSVSSAFAHDNVGVQYSPGYGAPNYYTAPAYRDFRAPRSYAEMIRQIRACRRHAQLHRELGQLHSDEHDEGFDSRGDHRDLHEELGEAHDAYHNDHPRADFCNRYMSNSYRFRGYPQQGYGSYGYNNGYSGYGYGR